MDAWLFVVVAAAVTVAPGVALSLLCRAEAQKREERLVPRWSKARAITTVALGGAAAVSLIPDSVGQKANAEPERPSGDVVDESRMP